MYTLKTGIPWLDRQPAWLRLLIGLLLPLLVLLGTAIYSLHPGHFALAATRASANRRAAAAVNQNCSLIVPQQPLTPQGLATPYLLLATNPQDGPCHEANPAQSAFIQAAILDPAKGTISIYAPLVIDQGSSPARRNVVPRLVAGAVVGIWFGFNGAALTLQDSSGSLGQGHCVNGGPDGSIFGQVSYCNATAFFQAAEAAIAAGALPVPALGMAKDGQPCPSVRDFSIVDQDQSDNVTTEYLAAQNGQIAQDTQPNRQALGQNAQVLANGSDNRLMDAFVDPALGCTPWLAPDLTDPGQMVPAQALNELQAAALQGQPMALVPLGDPMVLVNGKANLAKTNAYRAGVDQPAAQHTQDAATRTYCQHLRTIAPARLLADAQFTQAAPTVDPAAANTLFTFLAQRFVFSYEQPVGKGLNCLARLKQPDPVVVQTDANGVAISATINGQGPPNPQQGGVDCVVNGTALADCSGTAAINGQLCAFAYAADRRQVTVTCPAPGD
jgi:hypothetical protein